MSQDESSKNTSHSIDRERYEAAMGPILAAVPEPMRSQLEGPMRKGDPHQLLIVLKQLRNQLDFLIKKMEGKLGGSS